MPDNTLTETADWIDGIYQIETDDPVVGGPDGVSNRQGKELACRTAYLRSQLAAAAGALAAHEAGRNHPAATTDAKGMVELATADEALAGEDATRAVTPADLKAALEAAAGDASGRLLNTQIFTASGTYVPTPGMASIIAYVQGGGGGGSGCTLPSAGNVSIGSPGTAGAFAVGQFTAADVEASLPVTVGNGGTSDAGVAGGAGGTSSVGALISAPGGLGGGMVGNVAAPVSSGTGSVTSAPAGANIFSSIGAATQISLALSVNAAVGGAGGNSIFGAGGNGTGVNGVPAPARNYGAGGAGVVINNGWGGSASGSVGKSGIVIIVEYA